MMDSTHHSFDILSLHTSALEGDFEGVRRAIESGADVNALDEAGKNALMCAVAGRDWNNLQTSHADSMTRDRLDIIRLLLDHPDVSLFTLNAPQSAFNGVTPLGMASWLNQIGAVNLLLDGSADTVSVDGMDCHGATALMYAARDGSVDIVQVLLRHGARPDFRDRNHRSAIQFSLDHPQVLYLCETVLRRHRWRESKSDTHCKVVVRCDEFEALAPVTPDELFSLPNPMAAIARGPSSRTTQTLIQSISSSNVSLLRSLLFTSPVLANQPDSKGWSPIHHCASTSPSVEILDTLYCAGADMSLFTTHEHYTPLHCLGRYAAGSDQHDDTSQLLYNFTVHLICDLRAPLSARDRHDETCIHIAAEHGESVDVLMAFLDCDTTGVVRELRNARGLTALEVAKPEFRVAFGEDAENKRSASSMSCRTIRPNASSASLSSFMDWKVQQSPYHMETLVVSQDLDVSTAAHQLLANLRLTSPSTRHGTNATHLEYLKGILRETSNVSQRLLESFRGRTEEASQVMRDMTSDYESISMLLDIVSQAVDTELSTRHLTSIHPGKRHRGSEDSEATAVSSTSRLPISFDKHASPSMTAMTDTPHGHVSVSTQTDIPTTVHTISRKRSGPLAQLFNTLALSSTTFNDSTYRTHQANLQKIEREIQDLKNSPDLLGSAERLRKLSKKKKKEETRIRDLKGEERDGNAALNEKSKLRGWLKRNILSERSPNAPLIAVIDIDEDGCAVGREVVDSAAAQLPNQDSISDALRGSRHILSAARQDLANIMKCLVAAQKYIEKANYSISRTERIINRSLKKREAMIASLLSSGASAVFIRPSPSSSGGSPGALGYANYLTSRPNNASLLMTTPNSSCVSLAETLIEGDDEDSRAIRRYVLRKIEAATSGALAEIDKVDDWLRVLKEVIRGVKRRAYL